MLSLALLVAVAATGQAVGVGNGGDPFGGLPSPPFAVDPGNPSGAPPGSQPTTPIPGPGSGPSCSGTGDPTSGDGSNNSGTCTAGAATNGHCCGCCCSSCSGGGSSTATQPSGYTAPTEGDKDGDGWPDDQDPWPNNASLPGVSYSPGSAGSTYPWKATNNMFSDFNVTSSDPTGAAGSSNSSSLYSAAGGSANGSSGFPTNWGFPTASSINDTPVTWTMNFSPQFMSVTLFNQPVQMSTDPTTMLSALNPGLDTVRQLFRGIMAAMLGVGFAFKVVNDIKQA